MVLAKIVLKDQNDWRLVFLHWHGLTTLIVMFCLPIYMQIMCINNLSS